MDARVIEAALVAVPVAIWFGIYGLALAATRPYVPDPAPATDELGPEPPAIASLLVNHWEVTEDAAESTLLDLGARHILEFRQPANDPMQTTVHIRQTNPTGLSGYEQRIFDRVNGLAAGGVVPLTALTFRDKAQAAAWTKRLTAEVVADARSHNLSQRRFGPRIVSALTLCAAAVGVSVAAGLVYGLGRTNNHDTGQAALAGGFFTFIFLSVISGRPHGERDTPIGREAAARWLGVRAWLRGHDAFADLPPAAVAVWDRYLSYGDAVGATRVAAAVIDLGMGNRKRVWSAFSGSPGQPAWHRVRVHYPRFWPHYGKTAPRTILRAVIFGVIGIVLIRLWYRSVDDALSVNAASHRIDPWAALIKNIGIVVGGVFVVYAVYMIVRTVIDLASPATVTGEVVWTELWRTTGQNNNGHSQPTLHYLAVDDASSDATRAWALPAALSHQCVDSDVVTIKARRWSRRVLEVTVVAQGNARSLAQSTYGTSADNTEQMIAAAMGIPNAPTGGGLGPLGGLIVPLTPIGPLLTPQEVGGALGMPVTLRARRQGQGTPAEVTEYLGPDGKPVLMMMRSGGMIARMAMRSRRSGQELPGIGDEARGGPGWIVARRGTEVVAMHLGQASQATPPGTFAGLAYTAVNRLPAGVS